MDFSWLFISKTQLLKFTEFETIQNLNILTWENFYLPSSDLIIDKNRNIFLGEDDGSNSTGPAWRSTADLPLVPILLTIIGILIILLVIIDLIFFKTKQTGEDGRFWGGDYNVILPRSNLPALYQNKILQEIWS